MRPALGGQCKQSKEALDRALPRADERTRCALAKLGARRSGSPKARLHFARFSRRREERGAASPRPTSNLRPSPRPPPISLTGMYENAVLENVFGTIVRRPSLALCCCCCRRSLSSSPFPSRTVDLAGCRGRCSGTSFPVIRSARFLADDRPSEPIRCVQIIPQIVVNYRRKDVEGLSIWLMCVLLLPSPFLVPPYPRAAADPRAVVSAPAAAGSSGASRASSSASTASPRTLTCRSSSSRSCSARSPPSAGSRSVAPPSRLKAPAARCAVSSA